MERDEHELTGTQTRTPKAQSWSMVTRKSNESYSQSKKAEGSQAEGGQAEGSQAEGGQAEASRAEASQAEGSQAEGSRKIKADLAAFLSISIPPLRTFETTPLYIREQPSTSTFMERLRAKSSGDSGTESCVSSGSSSRSDSEGLIKPLNIFSKEKVKKKEKGKQKKHKKEAKSKHADSHSVRLPDSSGDSGTESCVSSGSSSRSDSEGWKKPLKSFSKEKVKKKEKGKQKKHKKESKSKYAESSDTSEHRSSISDSSMGDELRMLRRELREEKQKLREKKQKLREEEQKLREEKQKLREEELQKLNRKARDLAAGLSIRIPPSRRSETTSLREQPATYSKLSPEAAITLPKLPSPKLTQEKCIKPDDILFYLMNKGVDVEMVRFGINHESFEIYMNRYQWAGIKEEIHRKFQHDPPYEITLLSSDDCGVVTELSGYTDSGVSVSIGEERSSGKVSLILLKSEQQPCMLMMAHVLSDLKGLKSRLGDAIWEKMWSLKSIYFDKDDYRAVIDALNILLDKQDLKIELNYPEHRANQPNGEERVTISGTKILGLAYDVAADKTNEDWDELRNKLPPDSLPIAFLACDAALIELRIDDFGSTAATQLEDFSRICIANDELRRISNIFEVLDLTDETWENVAKKSLFCDGLELNVQLPPRSEARRAQGFGTHSMWKPRLIAEPKDGNPRLLTNEFARGNSGMMSVRDNDQEIGSSVSSLGALHSNAERMRQLYFIPIWHQLRAMKYLPNYDVLTPENDYYLINQPAAIAFHHSRLEERAIVLHPTEDIDE